MSLDQLLVVLAAVLLLYSALRFIQDLVSCQRLKQQHHCLPCPSLPEPVPLFGLTLLLSQFRLSSSTIRNESIRSQLDAYGSTFSTSESPFRKRYFTIEPKNLQAVFSIDSSSWGVEPLRRFVLAPLIGRGVMNSDGPEWEAHRSLLRPVLSKTQLLKAEDLERHVSRMIAAIPIAPLNPDGNNEGFGHTIDMQPLLARQSLDVATEFLFGESTVTLAEGSSFDAETFLKTYNYALRGVGKRMALPFWNVFTRDRKWWDSCSMARNLVDRYIRQAEARQQQSHDGRENDEHSSLAKELSQGSQSTFSRTILLDSLLTQGHSADRVRDALLNVFMPAHDANAILLTNVLFCLARKPAAFTRLRSEVISALPDKSSVATSVLSGSAFTLSSSLPYTNAVIRETLRLFPSIGTTSRIALRNTVLPCGGGPDGDAPILVKKGDVLSTSFYALHRREIDWGKNADCWMPERWLRDSNEDQSKITGSCSYQSQQRDDVDSIKEGSFPAGAKRDSHSPFKSWTYLPFSAGPRVCPGQGFAMAEVTYTLIRLVQTFDAIENRDPVERFVERYKLSTESANGAKVAFRVARV